MKKRVKKLTAGVLAALLLLLSLSVAVSAADTSTDNGTTRYTQKIVAVVYDESSSMHHDAMREPAARYSLEMLMSLLDERDQMVIVPMNSDGKGIKVDLAASDRDAELDRIMAMKQLDVKSGNGTPAESMGYAIDRLKEYGLKNSDNLWDSESDKEYWLVLLTDGSFGSVSGCLTQADKVAHYIKDYPTLHTVYVGFGSGAADLSTGLSKETLEPYQFTSYTTTEAGLASVIQQISNQMSGRYPLKSTDYTISGNKITVNLNKLDFSLASVSLIAQDCGATVKSASYNGSPITIAKPSVIVPQSLLGMKAGFSCEAEGNPFFMGGELVFEFTAPVNPDKLSVFAEPALSISYYIECMVGSSWQRVNMQYINENLSANDEIRVGYEVREQVNGQLVDLEKTFGAVSSVVTYARTKYEMGQNVPLKVGVHELNIEVSVMDGAYMLRDSDTCSIEDNPDYYRVEVDPEDKISGKSANAVYTVFVNNSPATKDVLKDYTFDAHATDPEGNVINVPTTLGADGKITAVLTVEPGKYGVYNVNFEVKSQYNITRSKTHDVKYYPPALALSISGSDRLSMRQHDLTSNTSPFTFELFADGNPFAFDQQMVSYRLLVDGVDVSSSATTDGNRLTYVPHSDSLGALVNSQGDKQVVLTVQSLGDSSVQATQSATLSIVQTVFTVEALDYGNKTIDRFNLKETDAAAYFAIRRDGTPLPADELQVILDNGELSISEAGQFSWMFWLPCGLEYSVGDAAGVPVIVTKVTCDMNKWLDGHLSAFIFKDDAPITATYLGSSDTAPLKFNSTGIFEHIFRILLLILDLWMIVHLTLFVIGSFSCWVGGPFARPLPRGAFVVLRPFATNATIIPVNNTRWKRIRWHAMRLIPLPFFALHNQSTKFVRLMGCAGLELSRTPTGTMKFIITLEKTIYHVQSFNLHLDELEAQARSGKKQIQVNDTLIKSFKKSEPLPLPISQTVSVNDWVGSITSIGGATSVSFAIRFIAY